MGSVAGITRAPGFSPHRVQDSAPRREHPHSNSRSSHPMFSPAKHLVSEFEPQTWRSSGCRSVGFRTRPRWLVAARASSPAAWRRRKGCFARCTTYFNDRITLPLLCRSVPADGVGCGPEVSVLRYKTTAPQGGRRIRNRAVVGSNPTGGSYRTTTYGRDFSRGDFAVTAPPRPVGPLRRMR
jgi:hypothetical protein